MNIKITPLKNYILIRRDTEDFKTDGGIILPNGCEMFSVIAKGPGWTSPDGAVDFPVDVEVGDKVVMSNLNSLIPVYHDREMSYLAPADVIIGKYDVEESPPKPIVELH